MAIRDPKDPEHISRFRTAEKYELAEGTQFFDLFAGRFGSVGICGGYGKFQPGTSLPCHIHDYDESITIVEGRGHLRGRRATLYTERMRYRFHPSGEAASFFERIAKAYGDDLGVRRQ